MSSQRGIQGYIKFNPAKLRNDKEIIFQTENAMNLSKENHAPTTA